MILSANIRTYITHCVQKKTVEGENFRGFCKSFAIEYFTRLSIHYYKKLLLRKFSRQIFIFALTVKVFPLDCFDVYGIQYTKTNYVATVYAANMHVSKHVSSFVILSAVPVPSILLKVIRSITSLPLPRVYNVNYYKLLLLPSFVLIFF